MDANLRGHELVEESTEEVGKRTSFLDLLSELCVNRSQHLNYLSLFIEGWDQDRKSLQLRRIDTSEIGCFVCNGKKVRFPIWALG